MHADDLTPAERHVEYLGDRAEWRVLLALMCAERRVGDDGSNGVGPFGDGGYATVEAQTAAAAHLDRIEERGLLRRVLAVAAMEFIDKAAKATPADKLPWALKQGAVDAQDEAAAARNQLHRDTDDDDDGGGDGG